MRIRGPVCAWLLLVGATCMAAPAGVVKVLSGTVSIERGGTTLVAHPGLAVVEADRIVTGTDGAVGITFDDNTLLSLGPNSSLTLDRFAFDSTTHEGAFESRLQQGRLAVVSGKIAKHSADAMKVRTPSSILGVRGTEFLVEVTAPAP